MLSQRHRLTFVAITVGLTMIGASLWYVYSNADKGEELRAKETASLDTVRIVQADDHVLGNPNAPMVFIVYSDFACPFCKDYHSTMKRLIEFYGKEGKIAWVFRHIPLVQLHPQAPLHALASECVAKEGGNDAFWLYADSLFELITPETVVDAAQLTELAEKVGVPRAAFVSCMRSNELMAEVERDFQEAVDAGATASPFTVVMTPYQRLSLEGEQPFRVLAGAVQASLHALDTTELQPPSAAEPASTFFSDEFVEFNDEETLQEKNSLPELPALDIPNR